MGRKAGGMIEGPIDLLEKTGAHGHGNSPVPGGQGNLTGRGTRDAGQRSTVNGQRSTVESRCDQRGPQKSSNLPAGREQSMSTWAPRTLTGAMARVRMTTGGRPGVACT